MITANDLQIFILTYNRAELLNQTLRSVINQSQPGSSITVLDNGSQDHTPEIVTSYAKFGVHWDRSEINLGVIENLKKAQRLANRTWVMAFHDDDLLHPDFIKYAVSLINQYPDIQLIASAMTYESNPDFQWKPYPLAYNYLQTTSQFAAKIYNGYPIHYGATLYRSEKFKNVSINDDIYGKIHDIPIMLDAAKPGPIALLKYPMVKYRCHPGQDLQNSVTAATAKQFIALQKKYFSLMGDSIWTHSGRIFLFRNYQRLKLNYGWMNQNDHLTWSEFVKMSLQNRSTSQKAFIIGYFCYLAIKFCKWGIQKLKIVSSK